MSLQSVGPWVMLFGLIGRARLGWHPAFDGSFADDTNEPVSVAY